MAASIAGLMDSLMNQDDKIEILEDLKAVLGTLSLEALASVVANVSFNSVFECLSTDNREQLELSCDVITKLLAPLPADIILTQFHTDLCTGLSHPEAAVRKLCVTQIDRIGLDCVRELSQHEDMMIQLVRTLADDKLDVAVTAEEILTNLGSSREGLDALYAPNTLEVLNTVLASNDTIRFRVYEMLVHICQSWPEGLNRVAESGMLQQFVNELHKDDVLLQLNCLELLSDLAITEHGLLYLEQQGVITTLETMMHSVESNPLANLLMPGLIKFFGCIARLHPKEVCSNNGTFVDAVFMNLISHDQALQSLSIQTIGFIGSSTEGKLALEKLGTRMDGGVRNIGKILRESQQDTKIVCLQALTNLLKLKVADQTSELLKLTEHWYGYLGPHLFDHLVSLADQPFTEIRCAVLSLFCSLGEQAWGQNVMRNQPGFPEYLLDRSTERTKEGKDSKYEVVRVLADSPTTAQVFGQPYLVQLKAYCAQGPYYVQVQSEVAMEGQ